MSDQEHPALREAAPVASRGHNLVFVAPPSPDWAAPVLSGLVARLAADHTGPALGLCPPEAVDEWARVAARVARGTPVRVAGAHAPGRLTRLIKSDTVHLAFAAPETVHELVRRAALKMDQLAAVLLLWPEAWAGEALLANLLQDVPKETQRIVVTADPAGTAALVERHCWRAPVVDVLGPDWTGSPPAVRSTPVAWGNRLPVLGDLVEQLDPESLAIWTADTGDHAAIAGALASWGADASITTGVPDKASLIIAYDLPVPERLRELASRGEVLLLVPPGTEGFVARLAPNRRPVHARGLLDKAQGDLDAARRAIGAAIARGPEPASYQALAPLLERYEATAVAAALLELWRAARTGAPEPAPAPAGASGPVRIWVGVGKKDLATAHDLVGLLVKEVGVARESVGKVEIRDTFALVELKGADDPEQVAERMAGKMIRKRRVVARVDRGRR
ncbi:MAG TPA: DbpA RNA binding domain-containing protein [Gemmatimonadales bacterium]|nr:DbpA RNA binding domain-containing protein [Gemmatimonadales bacterium]